MASTVIRNPIRITDKITERPERPVALSARKEKFQKLL